MSNLSGKRKRRAPKCPEREGFTPQYLAKMVAYFEGVPTAEVEPVKAGMWVILTHKYPHLIEKFVDYFLNSDRGDTIYALYNMASFCGYPRKEMLRKWIEDGRFISGSIDEVKMYLGMS
jgi:hypothetical protein